MAVKKKTKPPKDKSKDVKPDDPKTTVTTPSVVDEERNYYFKNSVVEALMTRYVKGGCTDVKLRDQIMSHAMELLRQIIRTHNFHNIYPGHDPASFGDLFQVGWLQLEKTLYKFDYQPGHTKVFNMWSQIAKTVILAHIKREMRDKKNYGTYKGHLINRYRPQSAAFERFLDEARAMSKYDEDGLVIIKAVEKLYEEDEKPYDGLIGKLVKMSGLSRQKITGFLKQVRLRSFEFTDSPLNQEGNHLLKSGSKRGVEADDDE
jgi:hypothetical protein